ncbi:MAG: winged helix-turn-helix transcriptional regulator [Burkholderiaceae bacterium]|nr:winged helix-turn-helix transcriptional regulator [Burkholderiaceae bacterium]
MPAARAQAARRVRGRHDDPVARVLRQFRQIFSAVRTHFRQVEKRVGLGGAQVWALSVVRDQPQIGIGELARAMSIHQSTASNLVKVLVERRLVETRRDSTDRRAVKLSLLPAGASVLRRSPTPFAGVLPAALASLDARALRRLEADLEVLIARLRAPARGARIPLADM